MKIEKLERNVFIGIKKLVLYFFLLCFIFTVPLFYLLHANQKEFSEKLHFTRNEIQGLELLENLLVEYHLVLSKTTFSPPVGLSNYLKEKLLNENIFSLTSDKLYMIKTILSTQTFSSKEELSNNYYSSLNRIITNHSNLILDPDLDTYYLMDVTVVHLPRVLQIVNRDSEFVSVERLLKQVLIELDEIQYALEVVLDYEKGKNTLNQKSFNLLSDDLKKLKIEVSAQLSTSKKFDLKIIASKIDSVREKSLEYLKKLLENRHRSLIKRNEIVLKLTLGCWLFGVTIGFFIFYKVLRVQSLAIIQIDREKKKVLEAEKLSTLGEMASSIIHEIRNPLTIIDYEAKSLEKTIAHNIEDREKISVKLGKIASMSNRISKISNIISIYSRNAQNDPFQLEFLQSIFEEALYITNLKAQKSEVKILVAPTTIQLICRKVQIEQVLINMINNSIDALETLEEKWIKIKASEEIFKDERVIRIEVEDSGTGVNKIAQDKMFESFFTTKEPGKGTGLGLSVSRSIIASHRGHLYYDEESPRTKFVIILPNE